VSGPGARAGGALGRVRTLCRGRYAERVRARRSCVALFYWCSSLTVAVVCPRQKLFSDGGGLQLPRQMNDIFLSH
jgi:hypothetical protein